ncbi:hypothetical protein LCI18_007105 [Fusarium solani-melongenae]|uniref:Uncharacterized protein n=1 Tax=Fusarium solani subsp. cucurbitae TaxID=2747967 RepID=A0ACD3Z4R3_FUSSC|nr:hypothetical protein LCI18_007105 [Fusarium solani-melongenae]
MRVTPPRSKRRRCGVRFPGVQMRVWIGVFTSGRGRSSVSLTGIGYLSEDFVRASDDSGVSYENSVQVLKCYDLRHSDSDKPRTFAFHESCWQILLSQLESLTGRPQEPRRIAEPLFNLLFCLLRDRFNVSFQAHDFGGAFEICSSPKGLPGRWKFLLANPNAFRTRISCQVVHAHADHFQDCSDNNQDCFSRFPLDSFWASRFAIDKEMNFFALQEYLSKSVSPKNDWRLLYVCIRSTLRDSAVTGHLRNRRRTWQCVGHTQCLIPLLDQTRSIRLSNSLAPELVSQGYSTGQVARGVVRADSLLFRVVGYEAKTIQISVSSITFDCAEYVSGMRVFYSSGTDSITELCRAGLIMPYSEGSIIIPPNVQLIGVQVASSISGIVGLGFLLQDGDGPTIQRTTGTINSPPEGVGVAALRPRVGHKLSGLLIGLDACKFVSLQLLELRVDPVHSKSGPSGTSRPEPWYWHPAEPDRSDIATLQIPIFALDMNFGGIDGTLHDDRGGFFRGYAFFYTDGSKQAFEATEILDSATKRRTCIEQSIALDGPGGERIVKLSFMRLDKHPQVVKMFTNHGRTLEFRPTTPSNCTHLSYERLSFEASPQVLQKSNSCFTSVVLSKIRRIRVSVGIPGRTRTPDHVSGLCFEFWDSKVPVYRGERITGFTFWQAQESHPNNADFDYSGRITGIMISKVTLGHKEIAFRFGGKDDMLVYSFLENSYERLSGLAWSFDHQCDYIYAYTQPRLGTSLMLHGITDSRIPGKLFWQIQGSKGTWLQLSGLVFEYGSLRILRQAGGIAGDRVSVKLEEGGFITRMDVLNESETLHTNQNRELGLQDVPNFYLADGSLQTYDFVDPHGKETPNTPSRRGTLATLSERYGGMCVGIWVTMNVFPRATGIQFFRRSCKM